MGWFHCGELSGLVQIREDAAKGKEKDISLIVALSPLELHGRHGFLVGFLAMSSRMRPLLVEWERDGD